MFVEDCFDLFVDSRLCHIDIQFLEHSEPDVDSFELSAELMEIGTVIGERERVFTLFDQT
jgi:hypothetical protein